MKVGIVGYGSIGQKHARNLRKLGHEIAFYDPVDGGSAYKLERHIYDDKAIDAIVVSTPSMYHEGPLRAAIERGKHVLIEKPISTSVGMLPTLLDAAKEKKLVVMMGNNLRFHPCVRAAKWQVSHISPRWANFICGTEPSPTAARDGVILNSGAHEVDIAVYLFGPAHVLTATAMRSGLTEEMADFVLEHANGVRSSFHFDLWSKRRLRRFDMVGEEKAIHVDLDRRSFTYECENVDTMTRHAGSYDDDYFDEMKTFIEKINNIERIDSSAAMGFNGLETLKLLIEIRKEAGLQ